jgi:O-antigen/teichoic acid export membrane protein
MTISSNIKQLSKDILFYGLAITLQNSVGFILLPIYTRVLTTSEFGNQDIISVTIKIFSAILLLGMDAATSRYYFDAKTKEEKELVQSTWLWFAAIVVIPMTVLLIIFAEPISKILFIDSSLATYFQMAVIAIPFSMLANVFVLDLRLNFRSKIFSLVTGLSALAQGLAAIVFVLVLKWGILGVFLAALIGSIIQMSVSMVLTYRHFHLKISSTVLKRMLGFGLPLVPASISLWVLNSSNRFFLLSSGTLNDIALIWCRK